MKLKCPLLLKPLATIVQESSQYFYPSEPFRISHFTIRHPGTSDTSNPQFRSLYHKNSFIRTDFYQDSFFLVPKTVLLENLQRFISSFMVLRKNNLLSFGSRVNRSNYHIVHCKCFTHKKCGESPCCRGYPVMCS